MPQHSWCDMAGWEWNPGLLHAEQVSHIPTPTARPYKVLLEHSPVDALTIVCPMLTRYIIQHRWRSRDYKT